MFLVALTGGIGSGKSEVAKRLVSLGAQEIDADAIARQVTEPGSQGLARVVSHFGKNVQALDGSLDREALARIVFGSAEKRKELEQILHPLIRERTSALLKNSKAEIVIYSVPLLAETGVDHDFDMVVTVEAGIENQVSRLMANRNMTEADARARIAAQATQDERQAIADVTVDNSGTLENLDAQITNLWKLIRHKASLKDQSDATN